MISAPPVAPRRGGVRGEADAAAAVPSAPEHAVDRAARKERDGVIPRRGEDATAAVVAVRDVRFDRGDRGWAMLEEGPDGTPRLPKVPLSDDWLVAAHFWRNSYL